jgi:flagellar secretion chaperone FliS
MYGNPASARARYNTIDVASQVEAASPHRLIAILYEELLKQLDTIVAGFRAGATATRPGMPERRSRANTILMGLEGSLDRGQGGDLAQGLSAIYREARRLIGDGMTQNDPQRIIQAREMMSEIADAWAEIG